MAWAPRGRFATAAVGAASQEGGASTAAPQDRNGVRLLRRFPMGFTMPTDPFLPRYDPHALLAFVCRQRANGRRFRSAKSRPFTGETILHGNCTPSETTASHRSRSFGARVRFRRGDSPLRRRRRGETCSVQSSVGCAMAAFSFAGSFPALPRGNRRLLLRSYPSCTTPELQASTSHR